MLSLHFGKETLDAYVELEPESCRPGRVIVIVYPVWGTHMRSQRGDGLSKLNNGHDGDGDGDGGGGDGRRKECNSFTSKLID